MALLKKLIKLWYIPYVETKQIQSQRIGMVLWSNWIELRSRVPSIWANTCLLAVGTRERRGEINCDYPCSERKHKSNLRVVKQHHITYQLRYINALSTTIVQPPTTSYRCTICNKINLKIMFGFKILTKF